MKAVNNISQQLEDMTLTVQGRTPEIFAHRQIVTAFICTFQGSSFEDFRVAIFKPWHEVEEATSFACDELTLLHAGKPHRLLAPDLSKRWTVFPFAFVLKPNTKPLHLHWKHTEHRFVQPEEVETYNTVPDLDITLWRTLTGPDTAEGLKELREDHSSGARSLATKAVRILLISVTGADLDWSSNVVSYWRAFRLVAWHLAVNGRPSMGAAIERAVLRAVVLASSGISKVSTVDAAKEVLIDACMQALKERALGRERVAQQFVSYISPLAASQRAVTFLTLSISCAKLCVLEYARQAKHQAIHIIVLESRPGFEGVRMALDLNQAILSLLAAEQQTEQQQQQQQQQEPSPTANGSIPSSFPAPASASTSAPPANRIRITLATDASVGCLAHDVDFVILGSDRINHSGDASNKVGSLSAVLTTRAISRKPVQVIVAAETEKISRRGSPHDALVEKNNSDEVAAAWPIREEEKRMLVGSGVVEIVNIFFEWVGSRYVDAYVTERGVIRREDIVRQSEVAAREWAEVFENL
ncbi:MAG: hypothetical protein LQ340_003706 [Diploschistes diacapsis]|nr:MAG: hypothetical protein LQ340_003706 [Diploschistes diacapsis]